MLKCTTRDRCVAPTPRCRTAARRRPRSRGATSGPAPRSGGPRTPRVLRTAARPATTSRRHAAARAGSRRSRPRGACRAARQPPPRDAQPLDVDGRQLELPVHEGADRVWSAEPLGDHVRLLQRGQRKRLESVVRIGPHHDLGRRRVLGRPGGAAMMLSTRSWHIGSSPASPAKARPAAPTRSPAGAVRRRAN